MTFFFYHDYHQESPTKELADHGFPLGTEGQSSGRKSQERLNASDDSSDGNVSEESEYMFNVNTVK